MHTSELKTHTILINHAIKEYELKWGPLELIRKYWFLKNPILKLNQHPTIESQLHSSTLCTLNEV